MNTQTDTQTLKSVQDKERFFGTVASTQPARAFFFIRYYVGNQPREIFCHYSQTLPGSAKPELGGKCTFAIGMDAKKPGKQQAIEALVFPRDLYEE